MHFSKLKISHFNGKKSFQFLLSFHPKYFGLLRVYVAEVFVVGFDFRLYTLEFF